MKYMTKVKIVDAVQWNGHNNNEVSALFYPTDKGWINGEYVFVHCIDDLNEDVVRYAKYGDWIVRNDITHFKILSDELFKQIYIQVE